MKLYYHAGSANHGCEAIVRATKKILNKNLILYTKDMESDLKYKLDNIVNLKVENPKYKLTKLERLKAAIYFKIQKMIICIIS